MNNNKSFFIGLVTGSIAAAAYTFLHAPNSGKVTRKQLEEKKNTLISQYKDVSFAAKDVKNSIQTLVKEGQETISAFSKDLKNSVEYWKEDINQNTEKIKQEIESIQETVKKLEENMPKASKNEGNQ